MTVQEYYDQVPAEVRPQFMALRDIIRQVLDGPDEIISYQIPHFVVKGKRVVAIGAFQQHVSLFPLSTDPMKVFGKDLAPYKSGPGTLQFKLDQKLPASVIKRVIDFRLKRLFG